MNFYNAVLAEQSCPTSPPIVLRWGVVDIGAENASGGRVEIHGPRHHGYAEDLRGIGAITNRALDVILPAVLAGLLAIAITSSLSTSLVSLLVSQNLAGYSACGNGILEHCDPSSFRKVSVSEESSGAAARVVFRLFLVVLDVCPTRELARVRSRGESI